MPCLVKIWNLAKMQQSDLRKKKSVLKTGRQAKKLMDRILPNARKKTSDVFKRKRLEKIRRVSKSGSQRIGEYTKYGVNTIYRR